MEFINPIERKLLDGVREGRLDVVQKYIDHPDVDLNLHGNRLLLLACDGAHVEVSKLIINRCPHANHKAAHEIVKFLHDFRCSSEHAGRCKEIMDCLSYNASSHPH